MALQKDEAAAPVCGWSRPDCKEKAVGSVHLDAGVETCDKCGAEKTLRAEYSLCQEHLDKYTEAGDVTLLLLSAKEA